MYICTCVYIYIYIHTHITLRWLKRRNNNRKRKRNKRNAETFPPGSGRMEKRQQTIIANIIYVMASWSCASILCSCVADKQRFNQTCC